MGHNVIHSVGFTFRLFFFNGVLRFFQEEISYD